MPDSETKNSNPQPQSGASRKEKENFRQLPEDRNKKEEGQDIGSLAPLLHWDVSGGDE